MLQLKNRLLYDSSEFKAVSYAVYGIGFNRRGYRGCGGLEKSTEKSEKLLKQLKEVEAAFG